MDLKGPTQANSPLLWWIAGVLMAGRIGFGLYEHWNPPQLISRVDWRQIEGAVDAAKKEGKVVLYFFTADWCEPCHQMMRNVFTHRRIGGMIEANCIPVRVLDSSKESEGNPPEVQELIDRAKIKAFPTLVIHSPATGRWFKKAGYQGRTRTMQWIKDNTLKATDSFEDSIGVWEMAGPFVVRGKNPRELLDTPFPPEDHGAAGVSWRKISTDRRSNEPWKADLGRAIGGKNRAAYLRARIWSPEDRNVLLKIGSDDAVKVWLNGEMVHRNMVFRELDPDEDTVEVHLRQGNNALLLKVVQAINEWGACARFRSRDGGKLHGLKFGIGEYQQPTTGKLSN